MSQRYARSARVLHRRSFDRLLVLVPPMTEPLVLSGSADSIWGCFDTPTTVDEATQRLAHAFGTDVDDITEDMVRMVTTFLELGLLIDAGSE